jgi:hypothetical protein
MLTSEREVDERLRRMNEAFFKSLEGLGGGGSGGSRQSGPGESSRQDGSTVSGDGEGMGGSGSGERDTTTSGHRGFGHLRSASGGGAGASSGVGMGRARSDGPIRSETPFMSSRNDGTRRDMETSNPYSPRESSPFGAPRSDAQGAFSGLSRRESSPFAGSGGPTYPSVFVHPRSSASRDRSEEVIGRLELDYDGGASRRRDGADGERRVGIMRRERSERY